MLAAACACRLPPAALAGLARFRARPDVRALPSPAALWVFFTPGDTDTARALLALPGAELFTRREHWHALGHALPDFTVPDPEDARDIARLVFPEPVTPRDPTPAGPPVEARLVRGGPPRDITALRLPLADVARWAALATRHDLTGFRCAVSNGRALLVGGRLPPLEGEGFWGDGTLYVAAGYVPEPALPPGVLGEAFGLGDDIGLWTAEGLEAVPRAALGKVALARLRLGVGA